MYNVARRSFGAWGDEPLPCPGQSPDECGAGYTCCMTGYGGFCYPTEECAALYSYCNAEGKDFQVCGGSLPGPETTGPISQLPGGGGAVLPGSGGGLTPGGGGGGGGATTLPVEVVPITEKKIFGMPVLVAAAVGAAVLVTAAVVISK